MPYDCYIQSKLEVLNIYIEAVKKEKYEQTLLWTTDEDINTMARAAIIDRLKESKIGYRFTIDGVIIFNPKQP